MKILNPTTPKLDFKDVLIVPKTSFIDSRKKVNLHRNFTFRSSRQEWTGIPIISSNMDCVTSIETMDILSKRGYLSCLPKYYNRQFSNKHIELPESLSKTDSYALSCGINEKDVENVEFIIKRLEDQGTPLKFLCVDVANGYLVKLLNVCAYFRDNYPFLTIMAGNVVTPGAVEDLILDGGVDIVKIGIGSGAICNTRRMTGVGYPQLSSIMDCSFTAGSLKAHSISDGGITCPGDVAKAFCAGGDFVMLGSMLGGHDESPGQEINGKKLLYGMSSSIANERHCGGLADYRASEGRVTMIPQKGPIEKTLQEIEGGLRSCCTYINAKTIEDMEKNARFILVNNQYEKSLESHTISN